jgi:hypothetical protein
MTSKETQTEGGSGQQDSEDIAQPDSIEQKQETVIQELKDHLDRIAAVVARIRDEKYGKLSVKTQSGKYVIKHEGGEAEWFRWESEGREIYLLSTRSDPSPTELVSGLAEYSQFVDGINNWIESQSEALASVEESVTSADSAVEQIDAEGLIESRDSVEQQCWTLAHAVAEAVHTVTGNSYGTFEPTVNGEVWTLKYDGEQAQYLQVGNTYVLGRESPSPSDLQKLTPHIGEFIEQLNRWLEQQRDATDIEVPEVTLKGGSHGHN